VLCGFSYWQRCCCSPSSTGKLKLDAHAQLLRATAAFVLFSPSSNDMT
jgi:hypothetical protein